CHAVNTFGNHSICCLQYFGLLHNANGFDGETIFRSFCLIFFHCGNRVGFACGVKNTDCFCIGLQGTDQFQLFFDGKFIAGTSDIAAVQFCFHRVCNCCENNGNVFIFCCCIASCCGV